MTRRSSFPRRTVIESRWRCSPSPRRDRRASAAAGARRAPAGRLAPARPGLPGSSRRLEHQQARAIGQPHRAAHLCRDVRDRQRQTQARRLLSEARSLEADQTATTEARPWQDPDSNRAEDQPMLAGASPPSHRPRIEIARTFWTQHPVPLWYHVPPVGTGSQAVTRRVGAAAFGLVPRAIGLLSRWYRTSARELVSTEPPCQSSETTPSSDVAGPIRRSRCRPDPREGADGRWYGRPRFDRGQGCPLAQRGAGRIECDCGV